MTACLDEETRLDAVRLLKQRFMIKSFNLHQPLINIIIECTNSCNTDILDKLCADLQEIINKNIDNNTNTSQQEKHSNLIPTDCHNIIFPLSLLPYDLITQTLKLKQIH